MMPDPGRAIGQLPLVPDELLKAHFVQEKFDTRFRACARLLQALWRERQGLPIGSFQGRDGRKRKVGSLLSTSAAAVGRNFLEPAVAHLARREVIYQEAGALIDRQRLYSNLLSSMPLAFNLFAPLRFDLALAAKVMRAIAPTIDIAAVRHVWFEHSPGRREADLTGDRTAFDVAVVYERSDGAAGLIGIEVKYSESLAEPAPAELNPRYDELAQASGLFKEPMHAALRVNPLQQLFREHLLAQATMMRGDWAETHFMLLAPRHNANVQQGADLYRRFLAQPGAGQVSFLNVELEQFVEALGWAGARDEAYALFDRYLNWGIVIEAVEACLRAKIEDWHIAPPPSAPLSLIGKAA